ncbi:hypothetical protein BTVI_103249 [Pitangus sulphuratus]|nr:hypothetical protein BTVI_103249 [Pitangus sulphuratus]
MVPVSGPAARPGSLVPPAAEVKPRREELPARPQPHRHQVVLCGPAPLVPLRVVIESRVTDRFGVEGCTLKNIQFQAPCRGQGHLRLDRVSQSPVQPGFNLALWYREQSLFRLLPPFLLFGICKMNSENKKVVRTME